MASLADCVIFGQALKNLDPTFDKTQLERTAGPSRFLTKKQNLLIIYRGLFAYIRRSCRDLMAQAKVIDIQAIVKSPDDQGMSQVPSRTPLPPTSPKAAWVWGSRQPC